MTPRYPLDELQALASNGALIFANQRAERNARNYGWTMAMLASFICELKARHHRGVRTALLVFDGRETIDADKYRARFDEDACRVTLSHDCCEFFLELAVKELPDGATVLVVSFHLDGQP